MVSIPDWSRFRRGPPPPSPQMARRALTPRERYIRAMEKEAINEASKKGYFLEPTKENIISEFGNTQNVEDKKTGLSVARQAWQVHHIRYTYRHMKILGDISVFSRIVILILDHNYLESIDDLVSCKQLIKLDIHSNQISVLPDGLFWSQLQNLRILIAHDNPIGRVEAIHNLVACSRLQILTLYDSPLAIKRNYRHHVVNTIWSLKALDHHVVSDEEIIEDAVFKNTRFASKKKAFEIDLCPSHPKPGATFEQELIAIRDLMAKVNYVMAHYCPVLIIQKNIRFWLTYRRYRLYMDSRMWAATTIQRAWREFKGLRQPSDEAVNVDDIDNIVDSQFLSTSPSFLPSLTKSSVHLKKESSFTSKNLKSSHTFRTSVKDRPHSTTSFKGRGRMTKKGIIVDWNKLQQISLEREDSLNTAAVIAKAQKMSFKKNPGQVPGTRTIPAPPSAPGKKPLMHQKHFFGPVLPDSDYLPANHRACLPETLPQTDRSYTQQTLPLISSGYKTVMQSISPEALQHAVEAGEEVPLIGYRLEGKQNNITQVDPFEESVLTKREVGQDVRDMETNFHERLANEPPQVREKKFVNIKDKFMFERIQQTMGLSALTAVQQAYRDRDMDEQRAAKMQAILLMKERRELARERVRAYREEKGLLAIATHQDDRKQMRETMETKEKGLIKEIDKSLIRREKLKMYRKQREAELSFSQNFATQQTSVSKALIRHDRQLKTDRRLQSNTEKVEAMKDLEREQQEIVKKYLQHRKMLRQTENSMARAALDTKMLQDVNDRIYEAKSRIDHLKSKEAQAKYFTTLPQSLLAVPDLPLPMQSQNTAVKIAEAIETSRGSQSRKMYHLHVPTPSRVEHRSETRLTLSGGRSRYQPVHE